MRGAARWTCSPLVLNENRLQGWVAAEGTGCARPADPASVAAWRHRRRQGAIQPLKVALELSQGRQRVSLLEVTHCGHTGRCRNSRLGRNTC
jgi:hypothetical protein